MKFSSIFTIASLVSISGVMAAPAPMPAAPMVTPAPAAAVFRKRVPVVAAPAPVAAVRDLDANEAQSLVQGLYNGDNSNNYNSNGNGNGYNSNGNGYNGNGNGNGNSWDNSDDSGNDNSDGTDISSVNDYIYNAAQSLSQVSQDLRQSMNGQIPRPVQSYLSQQSSRIAQASRIADGGPQAMTRSASSFISLASAYQNAEATFTPNENRIIEQVRNGSYNSAGSFKAPSILAFASVLGATFVWTAL